MSVPLFVIVMALLLLYSDVLVVHMIRLCFTFNCMINFNKRIYAGTEIVLLALIVFL